MKYRFVLKTPDREFYSEPELFTDHAAMAREITRMNDTVGLWLNRAEVWNGSTWEVV